MLGKIAKKLRIFGFDTKFLANTDDNIIIKMCLDKREALLTKDKQLYARSLKLNIPCFLIIFENELDNLINIMNEFNISYIFLIPNKYTRCTLCNGALETVMKSLLKEDAVPKKVFESIDAFFKCSYCQKIYWNGAHIKEINHLIDKINKKIRI